ncbi:HAD-IIB family hydrolase [Aliibacillus thermotolerans]|uniref:HAD-IIB family hydrolase n=1 Tax=Aliibacillus thermotolerans TaxID=1834418 RepID=A0ABW0U946_9BACI|nr:HAD-IIB family hydrolase [Aliibacillus thermotolerans]
MSYKLLALSVDGVLLKSNERMSKETKEAIEFTRKKGVHVVLVTNRSFPSAKKIAKQLKMEHEMISHGGALLSGISGLPILELQMNTDVVYDVTQLMERYPCRIQLENQEMELENKHPQTRKGLGKIQFSLGEGLFQPKTYTDFISTKVYEKQLNGLRLFGEFENEKDAQRCSAQIKESIPDILVEEWGTQLIIKHKEATKMKTLSYLLHELGIFPEEMIYIGSGLSDIEAVRMAGIGVAMGQSPDSLKETANWVTRSNDQNGMAYMIKEVFRKQMKVQI